MIRYMILVLALLLSGCSPGYSDLPADSSGSDQSGSDSASFPLYLSMGACGDWTNSARGQILADQLEDLERRSDGMVRIKYYDQSRLGDEVRLIHGVQLSTLDLTQSIPGTQMSAVPEAALLEVPGLFESLDQWNQFLSGPYLETMRTYYAQEGLELLTMFAGTYRQLSGERLFSTPEDLQGVKIRVIDNPYHEAFWSALGAEPIPYSFEELHFCLQEGIALGQENPIGTILEERLTDVQNCITLTNHMPMIYMVVMNQERYQSLTTEQQELLTGFAQGLREEMLESFPEKEHQDLDTLQNTYGMSVLDASQQWKDGILRGQQAVLELLRQRLGEEKVDEMLAAAHAVK